MCKDMVAEQWLQGLIGASVYFFLTYFPRDA